MRELLRRLAIAVLRAELEERIGYASAQRNVPGATGRARRSGIYWDGYVHALTHLRDEPRKL